MGLIVTASVLCDKCLTTNIGLPDRDAPLPDGWLEVQGYATTFGGDASRLVGYFCATCITANGTRELVKKTAEISADLTEAP